MHDIWNLNLVWTRAIRVIIILLWSTFENYSVKPDSLLYVIICKSPLPTFFFLLPQEHSGFIVLHISWSFDNPIDQFSFKNVTSLCPPCLGGFQKHDTRWVFQTMSYFSSGTGVFLGHCIIFCLLLEAPQVWRTPHSWNWIGLYLDAFTNCLLRECRRNAAIQAFWKPAAIGHILPIFNPVILKFELIHCSATLSKWKSIGLDNFLRLKTCKKVGCNGICPIPFSIYRKKMPVNTDKPDFVFSTNRTLRLQSVNRYYRK